MEHRNREGEAREIDEDQILEGTVWHTEEFYIDSGQDIDHSGTMFSHLCFRNIISFIVYTDIKFIIFLKLMYICYTWGGGGEASS